MPTVTENDITSIVLEMVDKVLTQSTDPPTTVDNSSAEDEHTYNQLSQPTGNRRGQPQVDAVDKTSLPWAMLVAKTKADIAFYQTKWKGIDKTLIDEADANTLKDHQNISKYLTKKGTNFQRKLLERFIAELRIGTKDAYNIDDVKEHSCLKNRYCVRCCRFTEPTKDHACFTRMPSAATKKRLKEREKTLKLLIFDFETQQNNEDEDGEPEYLDEHVAICVVARKCCFNCIEKTREDKDSPCDACGEKEKIISYKESPDVLNTFIDWLFLPEHNNSHVFAHYGGRYDYIILVQGLLKRKIIPDLLTKDRKIIAGTVTHNGCTIHLRDSYNLIPLPLASFKKAFGLSVDCKGTFPFLLCQSKYYDLEMKGLPSLEYYRPGSYTPEKKAEFLEWYNSHDPETYIFRFHSELIAYCRKDVDLLLMGLIEYRHAMMQMTSWCPLINSRTLPSYTMFILRNDHLPDKLLCNFNETGYHNNRQQSDHTMGYNIQHVGNGGEKRLELPSLSTFVDGFATLDTGEEIVFEYCGCWYHGHPSCVPAHGFNSHCQQTFGALYAATMDRLNKISQKYKLVVQWECDLKSRLKHDKKLKEFFDDCETDRLLPRKAMTGGRTEAFAVTAASDEERELVYLDYNSL